MIRKVAFFSGIMALFLLGYAAGRAVEAQPGGQAPVPGSAGDPVVSQSYVEKAVAEATSSLQGQVAGLQARIEELTRVIAVLEAQQGTNTPLPQPTPQPQQPKVTQATVTASSANVRTGPDTSYARVVTLPQGAKVTVLEEQNGWFKIKTEDGKTGWMLGTLLKIEP
ncbi:hypothetical protein SY88_16900 [Clostridiales bacterium PH28_bin88]|nr:hypothetical protein SY88_16900 [Clostridiales bacterium PH28_bin88]